MSEPNAGSWRRKAVLGGLLVLAMVGAWLLLSGHLDFERAKALAAESTGYAAEHPVIVASLLVAILLVGSVASLPVKAALNLVAGALLGTAASVGVTFLGVLGGTTLLFVGVRFLFRERFARRLGRFTGVVEARVQRHPIWAVAGLRLIITLPYGPITMAAALTSIRYRDFLIGSILGDLPVVFLYAIAGTRLATLSSASEAIPTSTALILGAAGLVFLIATFFGGRLPGVGRAAPDGGGDEEPPGPETSS